MVRTRLGLDIVHAGWGPRAERQNCHGPAHLGFIQPSYVRTSSHVRHVRTYMYSSAFAGATAMSSRSRQGFEHRGDGRDGSPRRQAVAALVRLSFGLAYVRMIRKYVRTQFGMARPSADRVCLALCRVAWRRT
jgi:hypothetical protein